MGERRGTVPIKNMNSEQLHTKIENATFDIKATELQYLVTYTLEIVTEKLQNTCRKVSTKAVLEGKRVNFPREVKICPRGTTKQF